MIVRFAPTAYLRGDAGPVSPPDGRCAVSARVARDVDPGEGTAQAGLSGSRYGGVAHAVPVAYLGEGIGLVSPPSERSTVAARAAAADGAAVLGDS